MNEHAIMLPFSDDWIMWNSVTLFFIILIIGVARNAEEKFKLKLANLMAVIVVVEFFAIQAYYISEGLWTVQDSLPFHMCRIMWVIAMIVLLTRNQIAFELLLLVGMAGGVHSLLTPEFTHGASPVLMFDYFLVHGGLIVIPLYCVFALGMLPRKRAWLKAFVYLQILVVSVGLIDYFLGANYMYLAVKPKVENPFLMGEWPYYIVGLELSALLHALLFYLPFYFKKSLLVESYDSNS